ncbi:hypothetical protein L209DRAFT_746918 [Thermothelomyces heterothallicus CBS 203.75]
MPSFSRTGREEPRTKYLATASDSEIPSSTPASSPAELCYLSPSLLTKACISVLLVEQPGVISLPSSAGAQISGALLPSSGSTDVTGWTAVTVRLVRPSTSPPSRISHLSSPVTRKIDRLHTQVLRPARGADPTNATWRARKSNNDTEIVVLPLEAGRVNTRMRKEKRHDNDDYAGPWPFHIAPQTGHLSSEMLLDFATCVKCA